MKAMNKWIDRLQLWRLHPRELRDAWRFFLQDMEEWRRSKAAEPRLWYQAWNGQSYVLREATCKNSIVDVAAFLSGKSKMEVQRKLKEHAVHVCIAWNERANWIEVDHRYKFMPGENMYWLRIGKGPTCFTLYVPRETSNLAYIAEIYGMGVG